MTKSWVPASHEGECHGAPDFDKPWCNNDAHWQTYTPWKRANYLPAPQYFSLNMACTIINKAFPGFGCYLVGSSLDHRDYRDVDIRFIMGDADFDRMFRIDAKDAESGRAGWLNGYWSLLCTALSHWLSEQSGLPIDFQIQRQTQANESHRGKRSAIGLLIDAESYNYPGELPSTLKIKCAHPCALCGTDPDYPPKT